MAILTTTKLGDKVSQPETQLDWCGRPYKPKEGEAYGGRPEHWSNAERLKHARAKLAKQPVTEERRSAMRAAMAYARSMRKHKKPKPLPTPGQT
jgi:hypothetical protein